mmetsp:Transcript_17207/g.16422  ORF Transcript_17207/g.16422 Transcript_17207/m.16422 type:complete len:258 (+) Transcript_17207:164-937(+)|eukprot:CAMPEP_0170551956 /NCGR_PEP_ID=MMETSP0211-20121228/9938_1 /TAXON_ID=311385 /ORGANISM="Pseudokeronopsis sp., Strain OXSARD2" /LENGTH=257 /DNA_ID=CAMNT_0010859439 /DNA_START=80 /DNA_END=853 /DNA_ORIENTATION=+
MKKTLEDLDIQKTGGESKVIIQKDKLMEDIDCNLQKKHAIQELNLLRKKGQMTPNHSTSPTKPLALGGSGLKTIKYLDQSRNDYDSNFVSLPPFALFQPSSKVTMTDRSADHSALSNKQSGSNSKLSKVFYEERLPYMKANIDLSFPELKNSQIRIGKYINRGDVEESMNKHQKNNTTLGERHNEKINNKPRQNEEFKESYFNSSEVPHHLKRFTQISKDNNILKNAHVDSYLDQEEKRVSKKGKSMLSTYKMYEIL